MIRQWLALGVMLLGTSSSAHAFTLLKNYATGVGPTRGWASEKVVFDYNPDGCPSEQELLDFVLPAFQLWNSVRSSSLTLTLGERVSTALASFYSGGVTSGRPVIFCDPDLESNIGPGIYGFAGGTQMSRDGHITFTAIVLNTTPGSKANPFLKPIVGSAVLAHEIGHAIGIGHSSIEAALMYYAIADSQTTGLTQDEIDAVTYLYYRAEPEDGLFGCGTQAQAAPRGSRRGPARGRGGPPGSLEALGWIGLFGLALGARHLRRRLRIG